MKKSEILGPKLPESVTEGTILNWHKKVGDYVNQGDILLELETDKVVLELPAINSGTLIEIISPNGSSIISNQLVGYIDTEASNNVDQNINTANTNITNTNLNNDIDKTVNNASNNNSTNNSPNDNQVGINLSNNNQNTSDNRQNNQSVTGKIAMPSANRLLEKNHLTVDDIEAGSGRGGRVLKDDVINALNKPSIPKDMMQDSTKNITQETAKNDTQGTRISKHTPMTNLRKMIAKRLLESQQNNAILTTFNEIDMKNVMDLRAKYKEKFDKDHGVKLNFMSFFIKASIYAMQQFPVINAAIDGDEIVYHEYFDIGIAVGSNRGLVVPIIRNAEQLSIAELEMQVADYGKRAKDGKLKIEELTGGTFSITNGGIFGSMLSTPIINPPQSAILGLHAIKNRPVCIEGTDQIVVRPIMYVALSYDHRLIDGKEAVSALVAIKNAIEDPMRLLLNC